jgi:hypothetical protein
MWRVQHELLPYSIVYRTFKTSCYPDRTISSAQIGFAPLPEPQLLKAACWVQRQIPTLSPHPPSGGKSHHGHTPESIKAPLD